jgi:hypothetical protein
MSEEPGPTPGGNFVLIEYVRLNKALGPIELMQGNRFADNAIVQSPGLQYVESHGTVD